MYYLTSNSIIIFHLKKILLDFFSYLSLNIYLQIFILSLREIFSIINNLILSKILYQNIRYL